MGIVKSFALSDCVRVEIKNNGTVRIIEETYGDTRAIQLTKQETALLIAELQLDEG